MQLNPSEISELIKAKIQNLDTGAQTRTQGTVVSVTDGICRIHGLSDAMQGEMLEFPNNTFGMALNLERDSVGAVVLGEYQHITEGDTVKCTGRVHKVVRLEDGKAVERPMLPLSLTIDHRAVTGGESARFLAAVIEDLAKAS